MPYIYFTEEQKLRASSVDLVEFLRRQREKLIRSGPEYRLTSDHSITVRGNEWYDHTAEQGGAPKGDPKDVSAYSFLSGGVAQG